MRSVALAAGLVACLAATFVAPPVEATTAWTARIGSSYGDAKITIATTTRLSIAAKNLRPRTAYTVSLRRGSCSTVGSLVLSKSVTASSYGRITQTLTLTAAQAKLVKLPLAIRVGRRCGSFTGAAALGNRMAIAAGESHTCAVLANHAVRCWGANEYGQLGDGTTESRVTPVTVSGITTAVAIAAGGLAGWAHTCALLADGSVRCWGSNSANELGDGTRADSPVPVPVSGITTAVAIAAGDLHTCAVLADRTVRCWGEGAFGQLGNGTQGLQATPVTVSGVSTAVAIAAGSHHSCALLANRSVRCWGEGGFGQLGEGTGINRPTPVPVAGITTAVAIAAGGLHTCAVLADRTVRCWGQTEYGSEGRSSPVPVSGITTAVALAAGGQHSCAVLASGSVRCWGDSAFGQLGNGTTTNTYTVVAASGIASAVAIAAGALHTCAVLASGTVQCWGWNYYGELGDGTTMRRLTPVPAKGL